MNIEYVKRRSALQEQNQVVVKQSIFSPEALPSTPKPHKSKFYINEVFQCLATKRLTVVLTHQDR